MTPALPPRLARAVDLLEVEPCSRVLEIGGGRGAAALAVCARLTDGGRFVGIDRSEKAVAASREAAREDVERGLAEFRLLAVEDADAATLGRFDTVFCVNVNVFWTRRRTDAAARVAGMLAPGGRFHLMYTPPGPSGIPRISDVVLPRLQAAGLVVDTHVEPVGRDTLVDFAARRAVG